MRIERSIFIPRPVEAVFAFVADPRNDPHWCPKVQSVEAAIDEPAAPGARFTVVHRPVPLRPPRTMAYTLVAWDPPRRIDWHEDDGHDTLDVTYLLEAVEGGTRFTQRDDVTLGAPRLAHPFIKAGIGHDVAGQLRRLRDHLTGAASDE